MATFISKFGHMKLKKKLNSGVAILVLPSQNKYQKKKRKKTKKHDKTHNSYGIFQVGKGGTTPSLNSYF